LYSALAFRACLGERTWEGYGRFRLDFSPLSQSGEKALQEPGTKPNRREYLLNRAERMAREFQKSGIDGPGKTQWNNFRNEVKRAGNKASILAVITNRLSETLSKASPWHNVKDKLHVLNDEVASLLKEMDSQAIDEARALMDEAKMFMDMLARYCLIALKEKS